MLPTDTPDVIWRLALQKQGDFPKNRKERKLKEAPSRNFDVLLTVHLTKTFVINQLNT